MIFEIKGLQDVAIEIRSLSDDKLKRREILKVLRRQAKPLLAAMKQNAPIGDRDIITKGKDGKEDKVHRAGNLRKSIAIKTSPSKKYPNVLIGPRYGKGANRYDGYYAWWIEYASGTHRNNPSGGKNFIQKTLAQKGASTTKEASAELKKYIDKKAKTLNL